MMGSSDLGEAWPSCGGHENGGLWVKNEGKKNFMRGSMFECVISG